MTLQPDLGPSPPPRTPGTSMLQVPRSLGTLHSVWSLVSHVGHHRRLPFGKLEAQIGERREGDICRGWRPPGGRRAPWSMGRAGCWPDRVHTSSSEVDRVGLDGIQGHVCSHQQLCHDAAVVPWVAKGQLLIDSLDGSVGCRMHSDRSPGSGARKHCSLSSSCPLPSMPPGPHVLPHFSGPPRPASLPAVSGTMTQPQAPPGTSVLLRLW